MSVHNCSSNEVCSGKKIAKLFGYKLTPLERHEILKYDKVYYFGQNTTKKLKHYYLKKKRGFHTLTGFYDYIIGDHLNYKYEILGKLGEGGYSIIYEGYDHECKRKVAIKNLINHISPDSEKLREIEILTELKMRRVTKYFVELYDYFLFRGFIFIVFEKLHTDLDTLLTRRQFGFGQEFVNSIAYSLFTCLSVLHNKCKIVHCDIKPENLLLVEEGSARIKLGDFGLSNFKSCMNQHLCKPTRYYQAPEVILKGSVGSPIDIWSAGCVIAELCRGQPLFLGKNDDDQIYLIKSLLGMPSRLFLKQCDPAIVSKFIRKGEHPINHPKNIDSPSYSVLAPNLPSNDFKKTIKTDWEKAIGGFPDKQLLDFLRQCLTWNPSDRITAEKALQHEYLALRHSSTNILGTEYPHYSNSLQKRQKVFSSCHNIVSRKVHRPSTAAF